MSVYIITCRQLSVAKIGYSSDPRRRLAMLNTGSPARLVLEAIIPGDASNEKQMHSLFQGQRLHGEWFKLTKDIEKLIKTFFFEYFVKQKKITKKLRRIPSEIIADAGGATSFGRVIGVSPTNIAQWARNESIPGRYHTVIDAKKLSTLVELAEYAALKTT